MNQGEKARAELIEALGRLEPGQGEDSLPSFEPPARAIFSG
jgi:hypothetical protein